MKLYKGRIPTDPSPLMDAINRSLPFDIRLLPYDVATNKAWAGELCRLGIFSQAEHTAVLERLDEITAAYEAGDFQPVPDDEDVHTLVERLLTEKLGPAGARIHTGRSRNDQVVCDLRLYTRDALDELIDAVRQLLRVLRDRAEEHAETLLAGTTHLQPALPITLGQFLLSLAFALVRDMERLLDARKRVNLCPLGSGAMAGSGFPVDRAALAEALQFEGVLENSIDAVADRDFCQEAAAACAILADHLSRYAEQFIIWANPAFGYMRFADEWSTGSSMMPQKRNPDAMELVRGKAARAQGAVTTLLSLTKGVPLTYAKDFQEDKEPLFDTLDNLTLSVRVMKEAAASAVFFPEKLAAMLSDDMLATDLADHLARAGVPFREAHERVGALVSDLEAEKRTLLQVEDSELSARFPELGPNPPKLDFAASVAQRAVRGGTAPSSVREQIRRLDEVLPKS
ncbi:MAG: argininosuccinate lyase [Acidobacteriota bacterium]|nr:argininosuccinate lyase [Acidobacteriota bacterium]